MKRLTLIVDGTDSEHVMNTVAEAVDQSMLDEPSGADETTETPLARLSWRWETTPDSDLDLDSDNEIIVAALRTFAETLHADAKNNASPQVRYAIIERAEKAEALRTRLLAED
jgi:hypothetical protein